MKKLFYFKLIGIIIAIWLFNKINLDKLIKILLQVKVSLILLSLLIIIIHLLIKFLRYQYILKQQNINIPFAYIINVSLAAIYLSIITPAKAGEISKAYFIHKSNGASLAKLLAGNILDRLLDIYILLSISMIGFVLLDPFDINLLPVFVLIIIGMFLPFLLLSEKIKIKFYKMLVLIQTKLNITNKLFNQLYLFIDEFILLINKKLFVSFFLSIIAYLLFFYACFLFCLSEGIVIGFENIIFFVAIAQTLSFLPITIAGIGTRDTSLVYLFSTINISNESALAFSTLIFLLTYLLFGFIGFLCLMFLKTKTETSFP